MSVTQQAASKCAPSAPPSSTDFERLLNDDALAIFASVRQLCGSGVVRDQVAPCGRIDCAVLAWDLAIRAEGREAFDRQERKHSPLTEHQRFLRGLLAPTVSLDRAYSAIQERRQAPPPQSTVDAFWFLVRQGDPAVLEAWLARHTAGEVAHLRRLLEAGL